MSDLNDPVTLPSAPRRGFGGVLFLGLFAVLAVMACFKYLALHSTVFDLGVFLSNLYSLHTDNQWWRAFLGHAQPLLPLYAQVYRLVPDQAAPLLLLTLQALALALPALWAARRYGMLASLAYALYFPVWTNALFDFHLDHLLIPILFAFLVAATSERYGLAFVLGLLPALVKEPYALTTVCCGLYLWLVARRVRAGWWLIVLGGLYFYVATTWLVPFCTADGGLGAQSGAYAWLGGGPVSAVATCLTHPGQVLSMAFGAAGKWKFLGFLFGALLFFPLFRPKYLLPALPALLLPLLSAQPNYYGWANHYTAGAAGALFFAFCEVLGPVRILARQSGSGARSFGLILFGALALGHVLLAPSPVSRLFLATDNFAFSMEAYEPTARDAAILAEILKAVPRDPSVPVVAQNTLNWGALAERLNYNSFPLGVFDPHPVRDLSQATLHDFWQFVRTGQTPNLPVHTWQAQYVLLDLTRPWFVLDRGCEYHNGACQNADVAAEFTALVDRAKKELETVYDQGGFLILRRPQPTPPPAPQQPAAVAPPASSAGTETPVAPAPTGDTGAAGTVPAASAPATPSAPSPAATGTPTAPAASGSVPGAAPSPAASGAQPTEPATSPSAAPADNGDIEVQVLDRFPSQRSKKSLPAVVVPSEKEPTPAVEGQEPAAGTLVPEPAAPEEKKPSRRHGRASQRHEPAPAEPPSPQATPEGGTPSEGSPVLTPDTGSTGDAVPAEKSSRRRSRYSRRHESAPTGPQSPQATPQGSAPSESSPALSPDTGSTGDAAPAEKAPRRRSRYSRRHESAPTEPPSPQATPQGSAPSEGSPVLSPDTGSTGDAAPAEKAPRRRSRYSRRQRETTTVPAPAAEQPSGGDNAPAP